MRTSISVPPELKARMDAIGEQVNWSAVACRAFEIELAAHEGKDRIQVELNQKVIRALERAIASLSS